MDTKGSAPRTRSLSLRETARALAPVWLVFVIYGLVAADCQQEEQPGAFAPPPPQFLARKTNTEAEATEYYQAIGVLDPNDSNLPGPKATLPQWKAANGFTGTGEVIAVYFNEFDLRFGREMHCQTVSAKIACYVTNYGVTPTGQPGPGGPPGPALQDAITRTNPVATVAMEYDPAAGSADVQFYTYDGAGNFVTKAALDSQGAKAIPGICQNCHGGTYNAQTNLVENANFLPFDVFSFLYSDQPGYSQAEQEGAFRVLNLLVKRTEPHQAIKDLIDGMYPGGVSQLNSVASSNYVPPGWQVADDPQTPDVNEANAALVLYNSVVRPYCRTCHIAVDPALDLDWLRYDKFVQRANLIKAAVCISHAMPHAEVTWLKFWKERPIVAHGVLKDYLYSPGENTAECGRAQ